MNLCVVIPNHSDHVECEATIRSVLDNSFVAPEIIVVDDASVQPFKTLVPGVRVIRNRHRCGVGPSRHLGVLAARSEMILLLDSHMRMSPRWDVSLSDLANLPNTVMCGVMLGLDSLHMDMSHPNGVYHGATINVLGPDPNSKFKRLQVFEANWNRHELPDRSPLACCMGACYAFHRDWFLHIDPLRNLRSWGEDEVMLSVKSWLAGGDVVLNTEFRVGHKFRLPSQKVPFAIPAEDKMFNKLWAINTLVAPDLVFKLTQTLRRTGDFVRGQKLIEHLWPHVEIERARNASIFTRDFAWLADRFGLRLP